MEMKALIIEDKTYLQHMVEAQATQYLEVFWPLQLV